MKKYIAALFLISMFMVSCSSLKWIEFIFKDKISVQQAINKKEKIDRSDNPALKFLILKDLKKKVIEINKIEIKDIISSSNIDYTFCVLVSAPTTRGKIDCYVYTNDFYKQEDIGTISKLAKGRTKVNITGDFRRFLTMLDDTFTKIEIINAEIEIVE